MNYVSPPPVLPSMDITDFRESTKEREWSEPFTFILGADTQFGLIALKLKEPEPNWGREIELTRDVIQQINKMSPKPRFFCICGDMLDAYPFSPSLGLDWASGMLPLREKQYKDFIDVFKDLDPEIKLVCVCGNHDMGDFPSRETINVYRQQFGQDYFSFWVGGVKFVVLNSQYMFAPDAVPKETQNQLQFMETIADSRAKYIVVFQHIPYFVEDPYEAESWNLNVPPPQRFEYLEKLKRAGVRYIFCGHYHRNAGGYYKDIEQVVTGPIGAPLWDDPSGYRVVSVGQDKISHQYISIGDSSLIVELKKGHG